MTGRSKCPSCGRTIRAGENIPVFSYLFLGGKCRGCGFRIPVRYPLIELVTGILFGLSAWKFGLSLETIVYAAFFWVLVVLSVIDIEHGLLPNRVVYPSFFAGWIGLATAALVAGEPERLLRMGLGALIFGGFFFLIAFLVPHGMGLGDVRLAFVLGTFLGYLGAPGVVITGMFLSFAAGAIFGVIAMVVSGADRKAKVRFGPFLALGTAIAVFAGEGLVEGYVSTLT